LVASFEARPFPLRIALRVDFQKYPGSHYTKTRVNLVTNCISLHVACMRATPSQTRVLF
jgi:hypothetical protein